jgi:hypothetical protein
VITCLPQTTITSATSIFDGQRFLFVNPHGCVLQKYEGEDTSIEVEFGLDRPRKLVLGHNRAIEYFDLNAFGLAYATEREFGLKLQPGVEGELWEVPWADIKAVALGAGWLAVANDAEIKVFDLCCHEIRSISFDREIVALKAH